LAPSLERLEPLETGNWKWQIGGDVAKVKYAHLHIFSELGATVFDKLKH
jgi:hypothetical protein